MMKIITKRISKIIVEHQILQGYQYASLPLNSTFEPLRIINEIIQYSNKCDKELWILALDMSKAYDQINIFMLEKVMKRIKFPVELINLLTGLSIRRKNKVFTPYGLTDTFDMQCGIDQGEIILLLLWIIYYDPLLTKIKNSNLEYDIDGKFRKILSIADTFYNLNDIKINKDKSELLLRKKYIPESLSLSFGKSIVNIKPTSQTGSIRLLEVWFNAFNRRNHVIYQIKHKINNCCDSMMLRKKLTDKQMVYIFNVLIIPRIEYRAQLIILSEQECNKFMAKFRILFKHKLKFMKTTPNLIIHLKEMFNVKNIEDNQLQAKTTNFILQINDKNELGMITKIRLYNLQQFIAINDTIDKMEIIGGNILIKDILPEEIYFKNLRSIKKLNIMFANQILTLDGKILLTLKEILGKRFKKFFSPNRSLIEKSWKIIEDCLLDNNEVIKRQISIEAKNK
ncbi:RNA-directed DNA polymerase from mobile element jockey-like [Rhizophagus irregularis DAOM 181602=DAOM 197198]|nr:RNA-directed DNA polymerase from mobile element jockey-like [Rhizophagus irregularis DAOM 181602=DAOM 197198]